MLRRMPSGPANRTRRQLAGAAAAAVGVCNVSALGEADQHLTSPQQHGEEPRKRICTLRSHMRDAVESRGTGQPDKGERFPPAQQRTPPALFGGKQQQQQEDQRSRQTQQHHSSIRSTRLSRHDTAARPEGEQLTPTKRPDTTTSTASSSTADSKEAAQDEKSVERESSAAVAPVTTGGTTAPPVEAGSGSVTSEAKPPSAAATEGEKGARQNSSFQDPVEVGETVSKSASVKLSCTNSDTDASSGNLCQLDSGATQRDEGGVTGEDHLRTAEVASRETAKISAGNPWGEAPSLNKADSPEKDQRLLDQQGYRWTTSPPLQDEIRRTEPEAAPESQPACGVRQRTPAATLQDKRDSLSAAVSDTLEMRTVHAVSKRDSPLHQRVSPAEKTPFFEESRHHWQRKATEWSDSSSLTGQRSPSEEQPKTMNTRQPQQDHADAYQVPSACFEVQALPQGMQMSQVVQQRHTSRGEQLLPPKEEQLSDGQKVLHKTQKVLQRSEELAERSQPPSLEAKEEQQNYAADVGELGRQLFCAPGGAGRRQGGQQLCRSEDIRFFLRLGGVETSLWRSVHVSNAFLKDSWRAQRFFCRLFGVDVGDVVGLVDEQGFVSPFDGEELFIRNGGTYTLELTHTKTGEGAGSGGQCVSAGSLSSGRHINQPAFQCDRAAAGAPCDRDAVLTRVRPAAAIDGGTRAAWQQTFATESLPVKNGHTSVFNSEPNQILGVPTARAASSFYKQTAQQALCREECSAAATKRATGKRGACEVVRGQQPDRLLQDIRLVPPNHTSRLPPGEQPVWRQESGTCAAASSRMSTKSANGKIFVYGGDDDNADIRNRKDIPIWGGTREVPEEIPGSTGVGGAARSGTHSRSMPQPGDVAGMPSAGAQEIRNSRTPVIHCADELLHGEAGEQPRTQTLYNQAEGQSLRGLQEARGGVAALQRTRRGDENWQAAEPPAAGGQAGGRVKHDWGSLSPTRHVENGSSTGVTKQDHIVAELATKLSKLEDDRVSSTHQFVEGQCASSGSSFLPEQAPPKKQQQSRRASKLWTSAPLLVWRRRRLRRSLALHDSEDPAEAATRQLMAEQHVRAVLARVSQRKALRSHVEQRPPGAEEQLPDTDDTTRLTKKGAASSASVAATAQREGANKGTILPRPSRRNSAVHSEPLLVDSLLWKKISTEKIYVHQTSSYRSAATYTTKESGTHADAQGGLSRTCCLPYSKDHVSQQHEQQYRRQHSRETESPLGRDTPDALTCKEAAGVPKAKKLEEEEGRTSRFSSGTRDYSGSAKQYMLRPRLTNIPVRAGAQVEKKAHSSPDDSNSLQRLGELTAGAVGEDTDFNSDNSLHPTLAGERQEGGVQPFVSRRSSNANASGASLVQPSETQSGMGGDAPEGRSRSEKTGFQGCADRAEGSSLAGSQGSTGRNGARSQASSDPDGSEYVSYESNSESNGDSCELKTRLCRYQHEKQLQQVLEKQLFTPAELRRQVEMLETLKAPKQQQQPSRTLLDRLKVLLPPQTYDNIKLLLPSVLKTAERLTGTEAKDEGEPFQNRGCGPQTSSTASHAAVNTTDGRDDGCEEKKATPFERLEMHQDNV